MDPLETVRRFVAAIEAKDIGTATAMVSASISYENMPMAPIVGRDAVGATLGMFLEPATEVEWVMLREMVDGSLVMNERLDRFKIGDGWLELPVAGIFEVIDGEITLWRDYFDMGDYQRQMAALSGDA